MTDCVTRIFHYKIKYIVISINLFETDFINFHSKPVFFVIFWEQEISQDQ